MKIGERPATPPKPERRPIPPPPPPIEKPEPKPAPKGPVGRNIDLVG